ncbi:hypothetical protein BG011_010177 [Mortierella polycephala]|uniref:F-box domain-containing protein n=1 Tax=Mortierella polycephala TaxID=41804 RepID=A0A9P6TV54_9FUNG|nr:hypothetical protein BG011_010177 [Mortierella polycephala]
MRHISYERDWNQILMAFQKSQEWYLQSQATVNTGRRWWQKAIFGSKDMWRKWQSQEPVLFNSHLQEMEIDGCVQLETRFKLLLPYLQSLTVLRLRSPYRDSVFMDQVLRACPELTHLHLEGVRNGYFLLPGPWTDFDTTRPGHESLLFPVPLESNPSDNQSELGTEPEWKSGQDTPFKLRSLVLHSVFLVQSSLENLLKVTPHLQELKLMGLMRFSPDVPGMRSRYNYPQLLSHLQNMNLPIQSFHFAPDMADHPSTEDEVCDMISMFSHQTQFSFWVEDTKTPRMLRLLSSIPNHVTTLELTHRWNFSLHPFRAMQDALHTYLCESPQLMHLRAPLFNYEFRHLDIHHRLHLEGTTRTALQRRVWACRSLHTLKLMFGMKAGSIEQANATARIVFGYIARVCPRVQELEIQTDAATLGLESGLCLLAKLKGLEVFYTEAPIIWQRVEPWELDWMAARKSGASLRSKRQEVVAGWGEKLAKEAQAVDAEQIQERANDERDENVGKSSCDEALASELRNLGLLLDVKLMLDHMDATAEFRCWPVLHKLGVYVRYGSLNVVETTFAQVLPRKRFTFARH